MDDYIPPLTQYQFDELAEHMEIAFPGYGESHAESIEMDIEGYIGWKEKMKPTKEGVSIDEIMQVSAKETMIPTKEGLFCHFIGRWVFLRSKIVKNNSANEGRALLIRAIYDMYGPRSTLTRSDNFEVSGAGHFERTIEMVLFYTDKHQFKDVHTIIRRALKRTSY